MKIFNQFRQNNDVHPNTDFAKVGEQQLPLLDNDSLMQTARTFQSELKLTNAQLNNLHAIKDAAGRMAIYRPAEFQAMCHDICYGNSGIAVG